MNSNKQTTKRYVRSGLVFLCGALGALLFTSAQATELSREEIRAQILELQEIIAATENKLQHVDDHDEIANLIRVYGFYLDKGLWNKVADLFAQEGSIELAQRGVFVGQDRVREFLWQQFGRRGGGPSEGFLQNHFGLQPVIHVADDGLTAKSRHRLLTQMDSNGSGGSWGGATYENEYIKEDGVWKFKKVFALNTYMASYEGGWAFAGKTLPGINPDLPPDLPPTVQYESFPDIISAPFLYNHPVTGEKVEMPLKATKQ